MFIEKYHVKQQQEQNPISEYKATQLNDISLRSLAVLFTLMHP
jgi:hypothetical protein